MERRPIQAGIDFLNPPADESEAEAQLRDVFACWAAGVTVIAVRHDAGVRALTVSAFAPLSLRPPLVLACLSADAPLISDIEDHRRFTVNVLAADQRGLASRFADRVTVPSTAFAPEGDPLIADALASLVCVLDEIRPAGDHAIVIGRVERTQITERSASPLLYFERAYREIR